ncbi:MAG: hypothetical protein OXG61_02980 [Chloroflexi bacterium]|nr:hypothetical protein [Chloroflexota bacterium]
MDLNYGIVVRALDVEVLSLLAREARIVPGATSTARIGMEIDIIVEDGTLPLSAIEELLGEHPVITGNQLLYRITPKWGGPMASGLDMEIAVLIVATQLLRDVQSDFYAMAKVGILSLYQRIRSSGTRGYPDALLALEVTDFYGSIDLRFCFPADLAEGEVAELWNNVEQNWESVAERWRNYLEDRLGGRQHINSLNLVFDRETGEWIVGDHQLEADDWMANEEGERE